LKKDKKTEEKNHQVKLGEVGDPCLIEFRTYQKMKHLEARNQLHVSEISETSSEVIHLHPEDWFP
jgi:hypothetical protein